MSDEKIPVPDFLNPGSTSEILIPSFLETSSSVPDDELKATVFACDGGAACESGVFQTCGNQCQGCQLATQCTGCQTTCEVSCQESCQKSCQNCQGASCQACQHACESACQSSVEACGGNCMNCEPVSQCSTACESTCQNCQGATCQTCQGCVYCMGCMSQCEYSSQRPENWSWSTSVAKDAPMQNNIGLTAAEWNNFTTRINQFLNYKSKSSVSFTAAVAGQPMRAAQFNAAINAIASMSPNTALPSSVTSGSPITAAVIEGIKNSLNSIT